MHSRSRWFHKTFLSSFRRGLGHATGIDSITRLFLSRGCPVCDRPTLQTFCPDCQRQIQDICQRAQRQRLTNAIHNPETATDTPIGILGTYEGSLKQALLALKYNNRPDVAHALGIAFGRQWPAFHKQILALLSTPEAASLSVPSNARRNSRHSIRPYVLPIPLHSNRRAQRGYNQAELLGRAYCKVSGLPLLSHGLLRVQDTLPQHQLGRISRQDNLRQAFQVGPDLQRLCHQKATPPAVVLIDDIYTTGTTMKSAAAALRSLQIPVVGILSVARAVGD